MCDKVNVVLVYAPAFALCMMCCVNVDLLCIWWSVSWLTCIVLWCFVHAYKWSLQCWLIILFGKAVRVPDIRDRIRLGRAIWLNPSETSHYLCIISIIRHINALSPNVLSSNEAGCRIKKITECATRTKVRICISFAALKLISNHILHIVHST